VWIYTASDDAERAQALQAAGAHLTCLPDVQGKVDLSAMLRDLAQREINEVPREAGSKLHTSVMRAGLVDELLVYLAPRLLGPGQGMLALPALQSLDQATALDFISCERIGPDLRIVARVQGRDSF
jgi:diaminohydroxyphosphoribosylaminopyrimidine deaminase/5-amino-6-(5-phosphoribosylamino)uracil reductase